ncbi:MAG: YhjD/YihY/BrkB family envelope integrity protein [Coprobacillaceae bacterium]
MKKTIQHTFSAILEYTSQEGRIFRYSLSYCFLLALFPSLIIVVIMFQNGFIEMDTILHLIYQFVPQTFIEPFVDYITEKVYTTGISTVITLGVSCYMASNSFYSFMLISANEEEFKTYGILIRIKSLVVFAFFIVVIIFIGFIVQQGFIDNSIIGFISIFMVLYFFYRTLSFVKRCIWYGLPGAIFATLTIVIVGTIFYELIKVFTSYQSIYGPLASFAIALLAIYVIASITYFGYCLNNAFDSECKITGFKNMWFFNKGNTLMNKIEKKFDFISKT